MHIEPFFQPHPEQPQPLPQVSSLLPEHYIAGTGLQRPFNSASADWRDHFGVYSYFAKHYGYGCALGGMPEVSISKDQASDRWADAFADSADRAAYDQALLKIFSDPCYADRTDQEIYAAVWLARRDILPAAMALFERAVSRELEQQPLPGLLAGHLRWEITRAILADAANPLYENLLRAEPRRIAPDRLALLSTASAFPDNRNEFLGDLSEKGRYIHVTGSINSLQADLEAFAQGLLQDSRIDVKQVTFIAKAERVGSSAAIADIAKLVDERFGFLQAALKNGSFRVVADQSATPGIDLREAGAAVQECLQEAASGKAVLGFKGEANFFTANEIKLEHYRFLLAREFATRRITGLFWCEDDREAPPVIALKVPAEIRPYEPYWDRPIPLPAFQSARMIYDRLEPDAQLRVKEDLRQKNLSLPELLCPEKLLAPFKVEGIHLVDEYEKADRKAFPRLFDYLSSLRREMIDQAAARALDGWGRYISKVITLEEHPAGTAEKTKRVLMSGVLFDRDAGDLGVVRAGSLDRSFERVPRTLISYEEVFKRHPGALLGLNGLYFFTPPLRDEYNRQRSVHPREQLAADEVNFYIDAFQESREQPENVPLYNKAYFGCENGKLVFGRRRLAGGSVAVLNRALLSWKQSDVINDAADRRLEVTDEGSTRTIKLKDSQDSEALVFTPMLSPDRPAASADWERDSHSKSFDKNGQVVKVGADRVNLIVINNQIKAVIEGEVLLPSIGIVISLTEPAAERLLGRPIDGKYRCPERGAVHFSFDWDASSQRPDWYFGGGTLLVHNGVNLVPNAASEFPNLREEGWFRLLSMQTQETQLQDWVRGPRSILGVTKSGRIFVFIFSGGRGGEYCGANFGEAVQAMQTALGDEGIQEAINLDGGSSSALVLKLPEGEIVPLNVPTFGRDNILGVVRPVSSIIWLAPK